LKLASLFFYPEKVSQDIWYAPAALIPQINLKLRKLNSPSHLFQKDAPNIYPESGFEARYERVLIFYDGKKRLSFGFNLRDGYWGLGWRSTRAAIRIEGWHSTSFIFFHLGMMKL